MGSKADIRRRWLGAFFLGAALLMLIAGETVLADRLGEIGFIVFWLACMMFTGLAIIVAFLDLSVTRRRTREEHRALFENTLHDIARSSEAKSKTQRQNGNS